MLMPLLDIDTAVHTLSQAYTMSSSNMTTSTIGFPRIGPNREMKKALERFASLQVTRVSQSRLEL